MRRATSKQLFETRGASRTATPGAGLPDALCSPLGEGPRARSICIASGRGGAGSSMVAASLACVLAERGPTLLVDTDFGVGDAHLLHGVEPELSLNDVAAGNAEIADAAMRCGPGLDVVASGSGMRSKPQLSDRERRRIAASLREAERAYRFVVIDSAAGMSRQTLDIAASCDVLLLLTLSSRTAMTDAYALLKSLHGAVDPMLVVNRSSNSDDASAVYTRFSSVCERFLGRAPSWGGWLPDDTAVPLSLRARQPVVTHAPLAPVSRRLRILSVCAVEQLSRCSAAGAGAVLAERWGLPEVPERRSLGGTGRADETAPSSK